LKEHSWILVLVAIVILIPVGILLSLVEQQGPTGMRSLQEPSFTITQRIKDEAGISAYCRITSITNLPELKKYFTTIESDSDDYVLGSVSIPNYPEIYNPHVYVHRSGWIMAYYPRTDPVAKIVDVKAHSLDTTKLRNAVSAMVTLAGKDFKDVTYYDFRHPNATHLMFVGENHDKGDNQFTITLPPNYTYYEFSWALAGEGEKKHFTVNGTNKAVAGHESYWDKSTGYGPIAVSTFSSNQPHKIAVEDYGVLVVLYRATK
jgi:hypothetical protein